MNREFIDPGRKLVDETADWLCGGGRYVSKTRETPEGARSLAHILVVVPTAQSGRNLRLAIARRFEGKGVIPPRIVQPSRLIVPKNPVLREATATETAVAFQQYVKANRDFILSLGHLVRKEEFDSLTARFALLDQLEDIWGILSGGGLLMRDVPVLGKDVLSEDIGDESARWDELAKLESGFFGYLAEKGLAHRAAFVRAARTDAAALPDEIEEIVLPALVDPIRVLEDVLKQQVAAGKKVTVLIHANREDAAGFDGWGRPVTARWIGSGRPDLGKLSDADIIPCADSSSLSRRIAADYPPSEGTAALPALALCDADLYDGLAGAFLAKGYTLHNPERHMLSRSSLGRMIRCLLAIYDAREMPWREFVLFFRNDDVLSALGLDGEKRARVLEGIDIAQNAYIPMEIPAGFAFPPDGKMRPSAKGKLEEFFAQGRIVERIFSDARRSCGVAGFIRHVLRRVYAAREILRGSSEKEFAAAADSAREFLNALESESVLSFGASREEMSELAGRCLASACYSLEPESADAVKTLGWLELAWTTSERIALAGFHEGKVPDSVVGHPFLPDRLRKALGLVSNDDRLARDSWLLRELLESHKEHSIRAYVARTDDKGDVCRPSRLLYLCADDALPARIGRLFGEILSSAGGAVKTADWKMNLPGKIDPPDHFSASAIDTYVKCPFTYLLKCGMKMNPYAEKSELGADDFGTLVHAALEMYAEDQIAREDDQFTDAGEIRKFFAETAFPAIRKKYANASLNIELQLQSLEGRLDLFADVQAAWAKDGWRIRMAEKEIPADAAIPGLGFRIHGYIDRVDENINAGHEHPWCIIDYKTWDEAKLRRHVYTTKVKTEKNIQHLAFAEEMGFPLLKDKRGEGNRRMLSVQLPVYGMCLAAIEPEIKFRLQRFQYLILGKNAAETAFCALEPEEVAAAVETAKQAVRNIKAGIFWPPGPGEEWKWDFKGLFAADPVKDLDESGWAASHRNAEKAGGEE